MQLTKSHIAILLSALIAGIIIGASFKSCGRSSSPSPSPDPIQIHDTISLTDTIMQEKVKILYRTKADTFVVCQHDSIHDTIWMDIPIDHKLYADRIKADSGSFDVAIRYSGYRASLDSVGIAYHAEVKQAVIAKKRGWGQFIGIGIGAGYGGSMIDQRIYASPYVGVHVTYGFGYTWRK